ncbi:hypothetical protein Tco_0533733 [Tanacetum coccineum]
MSTHSGSSPTASTSAVRNTVGKRKEISQENLNGPTPDAALREYCDKHYNQLLSILAEKMHQEKVQQEKLKALKARLNFEVVSQHSESGTPSRRRDLGKRLGSKYVCNVSGSPEPRRGRSESPRKRGPERKTVFKRLEKCVFHGLGDNEKGQKCCPKGKIVQEDTRSQDQKGRSQVLRRMICPNHGHIKTYGGSEDLEDHLKIFQAATKTERWAMPMWCHMFNSTLTGNTRVWFDDLPQESIHSYDDLKKAFLENYL